jgi:PadR family transcriptional regulator PadR
VDLDTWRAQLRKGAAELAVLAVLGRQETYGLDLLERIRAAGGLDLAEGSIYPLLNRLQKDGKIIGRWVEDPEAAHPRKYYQLTDDGRALLAAMLGEWGAFAAGMERLVDPGVGAHARSRRVAARRGEVTRAGA